MWRRRLNIISASLERLQVYWSLLLRAPVLSKADNMKAKSQISRNRRQRPSLLDLWRRKKALRTKDLGPEDSDAEDGDAEKRFRMISQDVAIYSQRKADKIKEKIQDIDVCEVIANSPTVPFYVSLDLAPRSADANQEEGHSMSLFKHSQMYHAAVNLNNAPGRTEMYVASPQNNNIRLRTRIYRALVHERRVRDAQSACERLHRSGGCVVCFARGFIDWRTHKLANCRRGVTTSKDQAWRVWRTDHLRVPSGACLSCCIPQVRTSIQFGASRASNPGS